MTQQLEEQTQVENNEEIKFFVNEEEIVYSYQKSPDRKVFKLTVREILTLAEFTPVEDYKLTRDSDGHKYTSLDDEVPVEHGDKFTATYKGITPAS